MMLSAQETEKLVSNLVDCANFFLLYLDIDGKILVSNKRLENVTGRKKQDILGKYWFDALFPANDNIIKQQMFKAMLEDSIKYKRQNNFEGLITDEKNAERIVSWDVLPLLEEPGRAQGILLTGSDITELREREASSRNIDENLKNIFSNIKEYALYVINLDGNITYYGMGAEMMFGWKKDEIIFKNVSILYGADDAKSKLPIILEQVRLSGEYEGEMNLVKKDAQAFPVMLTVSKFPDTNGELIGYIFIAKDITERKRLEFQVLQADKLAAIGQLAAGMAHEINNPLFVISGRLEMMLEEKDLSAETKEALQIINSQADRIRKLVEQLLKFSRHTPPKFEAININDVIAGVLPLLSYHKLPVSKIEIQKDFANEALNVKGDLNQLQEVFVNLCLNGCQSMPDGGKLSIKTSRLMNKYVEVRISDSGCGIAPQNLKNLFLPFFSTKKEGTGLGLSITYNIIKNHNAVIEAESQINKGTVFIMKFPPA